MLQHCDFQFISKYFAKTKGDKYDEHNCQKPQGGGGSLKFRVKSEEVRVGGWSSSWRFGKRNFSLFNLHFSLSFILSIALLFGVSSAWARTEVGKTVGDIDTRTISSNTSDSEYYAIGSASGATGIVEIVSGNLNVGTWLAAGWKNGSYGKLHLQSGAGTVTVNGSGQNVTFIGYESNSKGDIVVDGGMIYSKCELQVGRQGSGTLTVNGGAVTVDKNTHIGKESSSTGTFTINGGNVTLAGDPYVGNSGTGTLTINAGAVEVGSSSSQKWTYVGNAKGVIGTINLNGGQLKLAHLRRGNDSSKGTLVFNGGTLVANLASSYGLIGANLPVTVNAGGGTIDNGGLSVTIAATFSGTGGMTFTGTGTTTLNGAVNYSGKTAVMPGTILAVANATAKSNILKNGLVVAGIPTVGQTIMTYTDVLTDEDISKVSCPLAPSTTFKIGEGGKSIVVDEVGEALANYWTGALDNDLSKAANWSGGQVPTDNANIFCATPATLTKGDMFAPSSITFLEGSAAVTIEGGELSNIAKIENLSSTRHVFNCAVSGNEIDFHNTVHCCEFRGGITVVTPIFSNSPENANARAIVGDWTITSDWSPMPYNELGRDDAIGSSITVQGELQNPNNIVIYQGSVLTAASMKATSSTSYPAYLNSGRLVINGLMNISTSKDFSLARTDGENATIIAGGIVYNTGNWPWLNAKTLVLGVDGINFDSSHNNNLRFSGTPTLYASGAATTLHAGKDDLQAYSIANGKTLTVCTTKFDSSEPSTITVDGKILGTYNVTGKYTGGMAVTGCGTLVFNSASTFTGGLRVGGTATVKVNEGCTPGTGVITLGAGTKLVLTANSSTYKLPNTLNLPTEEGVATIRIDGKRLRTGDNEIATVGNSGATENVELDMNSVALDGRKASLRVDADNKLILNIEPAGLMIIVR